MRADVRRRAADAGEAGERATPLNPRTQAAGMRERDDRSAGRPDADPRGRWTADERPIEAGTRA